MFLFLSLYIIVNRKYCYAFYPGLMLSNLDNDFMYQYSVKPFYIIWFRDTINWPLRQKSHWVTVSLLVMLSKFPVCCSRWRINQLPWMTAQCQSFHLCHNRSARWQFICLFLNFVNSRLRIYLADRAYLLHKYDKFQ